MLIQQRLPDEGEIRSLADLCIAEVSGAAAEFASVPAGAFEAAPSGTQIRVRRIDSIEGVNALDSSAVLDFGDADLVVIYGPNGTGKSGYARLIKHAAGARARTELLPNVFVALTSTPRAQFVLERAGVPTPELWAASSGPLDALRHVHVFDAEVARHYVTSKAEASYEPRRLRFLGSMAAICDRVKVDLEARKTLLPSAMPTVPADLTSTELATYVRGLQPKLKPAIVKAKLTRAPNHAERLKALDEALRTPDPATRIAVISKRLAALTAAGATVELISVGVSEENAARLTTAKASAVLAREAVIGAANVAFEQASLASVGEATWRAMWEAARIYSTHAAYPACSFPNVEEGAKCPLCQQVLDQPASKRLADFEAFVKGEVERTAKIAEAAHSSAVKALPALPTETDWLAHFANITDADEAAKSAHAAAAARLAALAEAVSIDDVPAADLAPLMRLIVRQATTLEDERILLAKLQEGSERSSMDSELRTLRMLDWCNDNLEAILAALDRLQKLAALDEAIRKTNTIAITKKKVELAQDELTGGYQARFATELKALGAARLRVKPIEAGKAKGKIEFTLSIVDAKHAVAPDQVLSEGEARVVALSAFLADVTVAGARTPFIFDDPISSLDQEFEERVVARLLTLARTRQVLVFTHRISLLTLLRDACETAAGVAKIMDGAVPIKLTQIALRRMGTKVGLAVATSDTTVNQAADEIVRKRLPAAKVHYDNGEHSEYESMMKAICGDLRILTERAVEDVLLNSVVKRFRRSVTTMNKLLHLAKISADDCALLDDLMTRLSVFEHSQSEELPAIVPDLGDVQKDAENLRDWVLEFKKRKVPAPA